MKKYTPLLIVLGIIFIAIAIYYFVTPAGSLPHFVPGYLAGSKHHHLKHGSAATALAIVCFIGAWFTSASKSGSKDTTPTNV